MKLLLLADARVGDAIAGWLVDEYPGDIALYVTRSENEVLARARAAGVTTLIHESDDQVLDVVRRLGLTFDLGVLAWWPQIVRGALLAAPQHGFVNTHPSLLPHNRGKHYNFWALVEQAPFGVTLHEVDSGIDTGPVLAQERIGYDWLSTGETLYNAAQQRMIELFKRSYPEIRVGKLAAVPQDLEQGSFHKASELVAASEIHLDRPYQARDLLNLLRARTFAGHPACWFEDDGSTYEVRLTITRKC